MRRLQNNAMLLAGSTIEVAGMIEVIASVGQLNSSIPAADCQPLGREANRRMRLEGAKRAKRRAQRNATLVILQD